MNLNTVWMRFRAGFAGWIVLLLLALASVSLMVLVKPKESPPPAPEKAVPVRLRLVEPRDAVESVTIPGRVEASFDARLGMEKPGRIVEVAVREGDRVSKGQELLRVDDRTWKDLQRRAEIEKRDADRELTRWRELTKTGAVSPSEFEAVERRKDLADVNLSQARTDVEQCVVRSPVDGRVDARYAEEGEYGAEGRIVFRVVNLDRVKIGLDVPERDIFSVKTGDRVTFSVMIPDPAEFTGTVSFVSAAAFPGSSAFRAEMDVENPGERLRPGMIVDVPLVRRVHREAIVVPLSAVVPRRGDHLVFVAREGRAVVRPVKIQAFLGDEALLQEGIAAGDLLVVEGQRNLQDGMLLNPVDSPR